MREQTGGKEKETAKRLLSFIERAVSPQHAVAAAEERLLAAGFTRLDFGEPWELAPGNAYYMVHHASTLIAFRVGRAAQSGARFRIAAAHTDFPCLRIKPSPDMKEDGYAKVNVEAYGGIILNTWLDRPLSVAGRVAIRSGETFRPRMELFDAGRPICTIPNLAIHLNKEVNKGVELNKQTDMLPLTGLLPVGEGKEGDKKASYFMDYLAGELGVEKEDILDYELTVYAAEQGQAVGISEEFISAPRLDNMTSVLALLDAITGQEGIENDIIQVAAFFDHEEIGSRTKQGAGSVLLSSVLEKLYASLGGSHVEFMEAVFHSMLLSVDVSHGFHPNQTGKYDPVNKALLGSGVSIKEAAGQSYATDCEGVAVIQQMCEAGGIPYKKFVNRSDGTSGSTLGSIATTQLPMTTVDVGVPLLAMHSARELMGTADQWSLTELVRRFMEAKTE